MENVHSENIAYQFLNDKKAKDIFAKIDYSLRSGIHIQREYPKPEEMFKFIERHYGALQDYYRNFFQLSLSQGGEELTTKYYYLDFEDENNRSKIPSDYRYREYLDTAYIVIGMLFLKMYKLDANIELDSVNEFIQLLYTEYEEEKAGLFKLVANSKGEKSTEYLEKDVTKEILDAFGEFGKLGWIMWTDEDQRRFKYMPSFERLRKKYQSQILNIDELVKKLTYDK
ncbi:MAG: hypothetical protein F9K23_09710 [Bacteroidetes bacterium]|nr:MAG: hypothetical protein F9K23_09710 [Bacteroidota bacterium]